MPKGFYEICAGGLMTVSVLWVVVFKGYVPENIPEQIGVIVVSLISAILMVVGWLRSLTNSSTN